MYLISIHDVQVCILIVIEPKKIQLHFVVSCSCSVTENESEKDEKITFFCI